MDKLSARKFALAKRNALSAQEVRDKSRLISEKLFAQDEFFTAQTVCVYVSFGNEVHTHEIIEKCAGMQKKIVVPCMAGSETDLVPAEFLGFDKLKTVLFGIQEPFPVKQVPFEEIDLVIAPGVAFDEKLNRVGFGKGFYDKFLVHLKPNTPIVALAFDFQVVDSVHAELTDVKITKIITEKRVIE